MKSIYKTLLLGVMVFALGTATASAATTEQWFVKSGGVSSRVTSALEVKASTNLTINDSGWNGGTKLRCEGSMTGTLEASGVGKISAYTVTKCENVKGCPETWTISAAHLPWKTELYKGTSGARLRFTSGGGGTPGWEFTCKGEFHDLCNLNTTAPVSNLSSSGNVEADFGGETEKTNCTLGGSEAGEWRGPVTFAHPAGVEAIQAMEVTPGEWKQGGAGINTTIKTVWKGTVKATDVGFGGTVECKDTGEGVVEPGGLGKETKWTLSGCVAEAGCESPASLVALQVPWSTTLLYYGEAMHNLISNSAGNAGFEINCDTALLGNVKDGCAGTFSTTMKNVTAGVEAALVAEKVKCSLLGDEGKFEGTQTIEASEGGKLEVS